MRLPLYRAEKKSLQILLSRTQAGPGRNVKQEQEEISRNHVPRLFLGSVDTNFLTCCIILFSDRCQSNHQCCVGLLDHLQEVCHCLWSGGLSGYEFVFPVGARYPAGVDVVPIPMLMWIFQDDTLFIVG